MCIFDVQKICSLFDMIGCAKENVDFFEGYLPGFWDQEPNEDSETKVDSEEEEKSILYLMSIWM
jgi:hypothetical protein